MAAVTVAGSSPGGAAGAPEEAGAQPSQELRCVSGEAEADQEAQEPGYTRGMSLYEEVGKTAGPSRDVEGSGLEWPRLKCSRQGPRWAWRNRGHIS